MSLSEDLRNELAAIAPASDCDRLAELSGLFHVAGSVHLRGRGEVALHLDLVSSAVARRAFALLRAFGVDSEIRTYQRAAFDRVDALPAPRRGHRARVRDAPPRRRRSTPRTGRSTTRRNASSRNAAAAARISAVRSSAPGSLSGPLDPHLEIRTAEIEGAQLPRRVAARTGAELHVLERARHAIAYAKGTETIADALVAAGAADVVLVLEERSVVAGDARRREPARERRPRQPRPDEPRGACADRRRAQARRRRAAGRPARARAAPPPPSDGVDRRARPPLPPAASKASRPGACGGS